MKVRELVNLLLKTKNLDSDINLKCINNHEDDHMVTYNLKNCSIESDNQGEPYILLQKPKRS
jgi:hypothetical protein